MGRVVYILNMARTQPFCTAMNQAKFYTWLPSLHFNYQNPFNFAVCIFLYFDHIWSIGFTISWSLQITVQIKRTKFQLGSCFLQIPITCLKISIWVFFPFLANFNFTATKLCCHLQCTLHAGTQLHEGILVDLYVFVHFWCNF